MAVNGNEEASSGVICPVCKYELRVRGANTTENIRRRDVHNLFHKYVCDNCRETYPKNTFTEPTWW